MFSPDEERPTDRILRQAGFRIKERPAAGEAAWERLESVCGRPIYVRYTESEAWAKLNREAAGYE